jgi:hypothetical protein
MRLRGVQACLLDELRKIIDGFHEPLVGAEAVAVLQAARHAAQPLAHQLGGLGGGGSPNLVGVVSFYLGTLAGGSRAVRQIRPALGNLARVHRPAVVRVGTAAASSYSKALCLLTEDLWSSIILEDCVLQVIEAVLRYTPDGRCPYAFFLESGLWAALPNVRTGLVLRKAIADHSDPRVPEGDLHAAFRCAETLLTPGLVSCANEAARSPSCGGVVQLSLRGVAVEALREQLEGEYAEALAQAQNEAQLQAWVRRAVPPPTGGPTPKGETLDVVAAAIATLVQHPDWSMRKIAAAVGCNPSKLSRSERFQNAFAAAKASKDDFPRGYRTAGGGLEAYPG